MSKYGYAVNGNVLNPSTEPVQVAQGFPFSQPVEPSSFSSTPGAALTRFGLALERDRSKIQLGNYKNERQLGITDNSRQFASWGGLYPNPKFSLIEVSGRLFLKSESDYHGGKTGYSPVLGRNGEHLEATPKNVGEAKRALDDAYNRYINQINGVKNFPTSFNVLPPDVIASLQAAIGNTPQNQQENQPPQKQQENEVDFELA